MAQQDPSFAYESTGKETYFRDLRDPNPRSRLLFDGYFHRPEELLRIWKQSDTLRTRLREMPKISPLNTTGLRDCQIEAITNLEQSFAADRPRALIQMATGSGKTYTAITAIYRLIKFAGAKRVLFLVDRGNLGEQTEKEFQQYVTPDDGRKFTELYNIQRLTTPMLDDISRVTITTIQRLFSMLKGDEYDSELDEQSLFTLSVGDDRELDVEYNPTIPIEYFDFIVIDECHRSIYNKWRQVLEYFDSYLIGLTATPSLQTYGFFNQNLVMEYTHERAVADGVNVGYEIYEIITEITKAGLTVQAGQHVYKRDKETRAKRWSYMDEEVEYDAKKLDRDVVSMNQIRLIVRTFKEKLFPEIFPGRTEVPKTLFFAKNDSHAEDIVLVLREEFDQGNQFAEKITYRAGSNVKSMIASFRNSYYPRIAVTVDMISTGTDIRPLECLVFMRKIKSRVYFEQMKGRGTRIIDPNDLKSVTPDAEYKTHFVLIDAIGVTKEDKTDTQPLERKPSIAFDKLLEQIAFNQRDDDRLTTLAGRLSRLNIKLSDDQKQQVRVLSGKSLKEIENDLLDATDPDVIIEVAREKLGLSEKQDPTEKQLEEVKEDIVENACAPFDKPQFRQLLKDMKKRNEQVIDDTTADSILTTGFTEEQAKQIVGTFEEFLKEKQDEVMALQLIYSKPYGQRKLSYRQIKELAEAIQLPPYSLTTERLWEAYKRLDQSKVKKSGPQKLLTNVISLVRFAMQEVEVLAPFTDLVEEKFEGWIEDQEMVQGYVFNDEQMDWLRMIKDHLATSIELEFEDFQEVPFVQHGGFMKARELFGDELQPLVEKMVEVLVG